MNFILEQLSAPEIEALMLPEVKRHLGEYDDISDFDDDLEGLIQGAREWVETFTGRVLVDSSYRLTVSDDVALATAPANTDAVAGPVTLSGGTAMIRNGDLWLRRSPILAITSVESVGSDGTTTAVDADAYELRGADSKFPSLRLLSGAWSGTYRVEFRAGFSDRTSSPQDGADVVPARFRQAMKVWIQHAYQPDEKSGDILKVAENLIRSERCELGMA